MPAFGKQWGAPSSLTFGVVMACAVFSCGKAENPVAPSASGGLGQGDGGHTSSGGGTSSGAGSSTGGASAADGGTGASVVSLGGWGGEVTRTACPVEFLDSFGPPTELVTDGGDVLLSPGQGTCPDGTVPSERRQCLDVLICACEYPCSPECGTRENCIATDGGNVCACHPALVGEPGACQWTGLFDTEVFDDCEAWRFSETDLRGLAEVGEGVLHLAVEQRCQGVYAQLVAQRPPIDLFPDGAALVFDYQARGEPGDGQPQPTQVRFDSTINGLLPRAEPRQHRMCVRLETYPRLVDLSFIIENFGSCEEESPAELWVGNVRFEADAECL